MQAWAPFLQITLPIVLAIAIAGWLNNRRIDEVSKRIDDLRAEMGKRVDEVGKRIDDLRADLLPILRELQNISRDHEHRITTLEERVPRVLRP